MTENKIYYGVLPLKKNQRHPTMVEAADANQIRYFGLRKIDPLIAHSRREKKSDEKKQKQLLLDKIVKVTTKLQKLQNNIKSLKTKSEVMETKEEIDRLDKERKSLLKKYKKEYSPKKR
jgi:hypothetical protein